MQRIIRIASLNHYQHAVGRPSVRWPMLKYAGASTLAALNDRRDLGCEERMSALACRTKALDMRTMLRPVLSPPLVSAGIAFATY